MSDPDAQTVALRGPSGSGATRAEVVVLPSGSAYLINKTLPTLPASETYQLWGRSSSTLISLGVLGDDPKTMALTIGGTPSYAALSRDDRAGRGSGPDERTVRWPRAASSAPNGFRRPGAACRRASRGPHGRERRASHAHPEAVETGEREASRSGHLGDGDGGRRGRRVGREDGRAVVGRVGLVRGGRDQLVEAPRVAGRHREVEDAIGVGRPLGPEAVAAGHDRVGGRARRRARRRGALGQELVGGVRG